MTIVTHFERVVLLAAAKLRFRKKQCVSLEEYALPKNLVFRFSEHLGNPVKSLSPHMAHLWTKIQNVFRPDTLNRDKCYENLVFSTQSHASVTENTRISAFSSHSTHAPVKLECFLLVVPRKNVRPHESARTALRNHFNSILAGGPADRWVARLLYFLYENRGSTLRRAS